MALAVVYGLVAPLVFLVGPLAAVTVAAGVRSTREWLTLAVAAGMLGLSLVGATGIAREFVDAAGLFFTGGFALMTLGRPRPTFVRVAAALGLAAAALAMWCAYLGVSWSEIQLVLARDLGRAFSGQARLLAAGSAAGADGNTAGAAQQVFRELAAMSPAMAALLPATLAIAALAGAGLAWRLHHALASAPIAPPPEPFTELRFSDHLVWVPIVGLGLWVAQLAEPGPTVSANLLLVATALFAARGAAVMRATTGRLPGFMVVALAIAVLFLFAFVVGGLAILGLADIWVDFRRRSAALANGGNDR